MRKAGYELLPHTTDAYIQAWGETLEQAFGSAGTALFDTMCNATSVVPTSTEEIQLSGIDEISLLYDWLESLLLKFELDGMVYSRFDVSQIKKFNDSYHSSAKVSGEKYDRHKHGAKVEVKAVTLHKMEILHDDSKTTLRFILDL